MSDATAAESPNLSPGRGPEIITVFVAFTAVTSVVSILRIYVRAVILEMFALDDYASILGWMLFLLQAAFAMVGVQYGIGKRNAQIQPPEHMADAMKWWWFSELAYTIASSPIKISIGFMLLRLTKVRSHQVAVWVTLGTFQVYSLFYILLLTFQCYKPSFFWTRYQGETNGYCIDITVNTVAAYVSSALTIMIDTAFAIMPWLIVRNLQMNYRLKIIVALLLGMASAASIATVVRTAYIPKIGVSPDFLYNSSDVIIWSTVEIGFSITASSAATLKPLFKKLLEATRYATSKKQTTTTANWPPRNRSTYIRSSSTGGTQKTAADHHDIEEGSTSHVLRTVSVEVEHFDHYDSSQGEVAKSNNRARW